MDVELINPFLSATINVIETMASTKVTSGPPTLKKDKMTWGEVTGLIGLAGDNVTGSMAISFDAPSILGIVSKMLGEEFSEINPDVVDAVGEITNMISGGAKKDLSEKGFNFNMATPVMLVGQNVEMTLLTSSPTLLVPFETDVGKFVIEACLDKKE